MNIRAKRKEAQEIICDLLHIHSIPQGLVVHHIDGNEENNIIMNLCLMTDKLHKMLHGIFRVARSTNAGFNVLPTMERCAKLLQSDIYFDGRHCEKAERYYSDSSGCDVYLQSCQARIICLLIARNAKIDF